MSKQQIYKIVATAVTALLTCLAIALGLQRCNVTRTITTRSEAWQKGDTSVVIQTKTIFVRYKTRFLLQFDDKRFYAVSRQGDSCGIFAYLERELFLGTGIEDIDSIRTVLFLDGADMEFGIRTLRNT